MLLARNTNVCMKTALPILLGSMLGSVIYVTLTYGLIPQDSGSYLSYMDTVFVATTISLASASVFFAFFTSFRVKSKNTALLLTASFSSQLLSWFATLVFP